MSVAVTRTVPLYVPAVRPPGAMATVNVAGVLPVPGVAVSQVPPGGVVLAAVVTFTGDPPLEAINV